jgi:hypothetical protein
MPDAVPGADEVIGLWRRPFDEVGVVENDLRMPLAGQTDHFGGDVESFDLKAALHQQVDEPPAAAASHIKRFA